MRTLCSATAVIAILLVPSNGFPQVTRQLFVTVVNPSGAAVTDLNAADFDVHENGIPRRIARLAPANDPMRIALIVDSSATAEQSINQFRAGLQNMFDALPEQTEFALLSIGRQARLRLAPTADRTKLKETAAGFFGDGGGAAILDGLIEGYRRFLMKSEGRWPVMVVITTDGPAAGSVREDQFNGFLRDAQIAGVVIHGIVVSTRGNGVPMIITMNAAQVTDGHYEAIAAASALPDKMKALAEQLAQEFQKAGSQYRIEYASDIEDPARAGIEVAVSRQDVKVSVSTRREIK
jgi:hypothetical protein